MSKHRNTLFLIATVMFSLSYLPGFTADAGSGQIDQSSSIAYEGDCDFSRQASCRARSTDSRVSADVRVNRVVVPKPVDRLGDPAAQPAPGETEDMLEVSIEASASVEGCTTGCSRSTSVTRHFPLSDRSRIREKALELARQQAEAVRGEAQREAARLRRAESCQVDEDNRPLEARAKRDCLMARIALLEPEQAAKYFDQHMKEMLLEMIKSDNPQTRADGLRMLASLKLITGNNPYLKESLHEIGEFGKYHSQVQLLARRIQTNRALGRDTKQDTAALARLVGTAGSYFESRGLTLNDRLQDSLAGWAYQGTLGTDLSGYEQQIKSIYSNHQQYMNQARQPLQPGQQQFQPSVPGAGRTGLGTFGGNNQIGRPAVTPPTTGRPGVAPVQPMRPGATQAPVRGPVYGQRPLGR